MIGKGKSHLAEGRVTNFTTKKIFSFFRASINFINEDEVFTFKERFDGYVFVDNKGKITQIFNYSRVSKIN